MCLEGAILVSKLFYDAKRARGLEERIVDGFEDLAVTAVEDKLELYALSKGMEVKDLRRIVDKIKAYNMVIKERGRTGYSNYVMKNCSPGRPDTGHRAIVRFCSPICLWRCLQRRLCARMDVEVVEVTFLVFMSRILTKEPREPLGKVKNSEYSLGSGTKVDQDGQSRLPCTLV